MGIALADKERHCRGGMSGTREAFRARMRAQCEAIERYQSHAVQDEGRELSLEEAAREWIAQFAGRFADKYDLHLLKATASDRSHSMMINHPTRESMETV